MPITAHACISVSSEPSPSALRHSELDPARKTALGFCD
jgi:hypothetical protein